MAARISPVCRVGHAHVRIHAASRARARIRTHTNAPITHPSILRDRYYDIPSDSGDRLPQSSALSSGGFRRRYPSLPSSPTLFPHTPPPPHPHTLLPFSPPLRSIAAVPLFGSPARRMTEGVLRLAACAWGVCLSSVASLRVC